jgi:diguanylate cyclase (GGDEF)-like protein
MLLKHQQLKQQFRELLDKAMSNQAVLERFQHFELAMLSADNLSDLLGTLLNASLDHFTLTDCRLIWFDRHQDLRSLIPESVRNEFGHRILFNGLLHEIEQEFLGNYKPVLRALKKDEKIHWFPGVEDVQSVAFIPLVCDGTLAGCLVLGSVEEKRFTSDKAVDFMAHMGLIAAVCVQNSANKERIRRLSMMDNLTQVKNRRCFDSDINKEVAKAQRAEESLSCLFLDADFFKAINDSYGHQAGDEVLCSLASWVKMQLREGDHIARYGGEEFALLLPQCGEELAFQVAERIRLFVAEQVITFDDVDICITVSIGVSTFNGVRHKGMEREMVIKALLKQADSAVYDAKQSGRNRVCVREFGF